MTAIVHEIQSPATDATPLSWVVEDYLASGNLIEAAVAAGRALERENLRRAVSALTEVTATGVLAILGAAGS